MSTKYVYTFGDGKAEGKADMKNLLGGKGANLAEMNLIGLPVPAGFTITTEVCTLYNQKGKDAVVKLIENDVKAGIAHMEKIMNAKFGSKGEAFPLMVSVRSGARVSMPGMMDTVLNLGLNDDAVKLLAEKSGNARFAWDSYRRFIQMYGDVVMGVAAAKGEHNPFEVEIDKLKEAKHIKQDTEFTVEDLQVLVENFKKVVKTKTGKDFPTCPWEQLWGAICAVFDSWMTERAVLYRQLNQIPEEWGTAVNVQSMVYGNMGNNSATGVAFSRDAATGEDIFNGEYLINAQGEDVVAGRGRPAERRLASVELPLELRADGLAGLRRRGAQPPRRTLVRAGVARTDFGRLFGTEHPRLPLGHRRRGARTVVRPRPAGLRGRLLRRLFGLFPGRLPPEALQGLHRPLRHLQLRVDVRPDRGAVLHQPRLRRGLLGKG